jgi:K+-transporting ATPase KdpF subunit
MSLDLALGAVTALVIVAYLLLALLRPERF